MIIIKSNEQFLTFFNKEKNQFWFDESVTFQCSIKTNHTINWTTWSLGCCAHWYDHGTAS